MYTKILIVGANSYLASQCISKLELGDSEIFLVSRGEISSNYHLRGKKVRTLQVTNYESDETLKTLTRFLECDIQDRLLILNFVGSFGSIATLEELNLKDFNSEIGENLIPFMALAKLVAKFNNGLFLSFSGAGIGGDNLEVASLSYLASKASLALLVEGLDNLLKNNGVRVSAISPGAFPSRMQKVVADSENQLAVTAERKNQALITLSSDVDSSKLISTINFLVANPEIAGGRVWSANFDNLQTEIGEKNFGKLRRVY